MLGILVLGEWIHDAGAVWCHLRTISLLRSGAQAKKAGSGFCAQATFIYLALSGAGRRGCRGSWFQNAAGLRCQGSKAVLAPHGLNVAKTLPDAPKDLCEVYTSWGCILFALL